MIQAVALFSMFGVGIAFSIIGALKLTLSERLGIDDGRFGALIMVLMLTCSFTVIPVGVLTDTIGIKPLTVTGFILGAIALFMLVTAMHYRQALTACVVLGIAAMCLNMGNILVPLVLFGGQNKTAAANFGNVFFGLGAFIAPFLGGQLIKRFGQATTGTVFAAILLVPLMISIFADFPANTGEYTATGAIGLLATPSILIAAAAMFCYIGLETSLGGWITTYATSLGFTQGGASMLLSLFWISILAMRLAAAALLTSDIGVIVVTVLSGLSILTVSGMIRATKKLIAGMCVVLTGLAFGPIFPTILGVALERTDASLYGSAFGIMYAIGLLGGSFMPASIGMAARRRSIRQSLFIVACGAVVLTAIAVML